MFLVLKSSCETLQAQEEGRRPTLCTLHVGLSEVRRATSAWRFIEGVIAKGGQALHPAVPLLLSLKHAAPNAEHCVRAVFWVDSSRG